MRIRPLSAAIPLLALLFVASALIQAGRPGVATAQTPPPFAGTAPPAGGIGLLVASQQSAVPELIDALRGAGCEALVFARLDAGTWLIYIVGAPALVNAAFPATLAANTPFFIRCAASQLSYEQWAAGFCAVAQNLLDRVTALFASGSIVSGWGQGGPYDETVYAMRAELAQGLASFAAMLRDAADQYAAVEAPDDLAAVMESFIGAQRDFATVIEETAALIATAASPEQLPALAARLVEANRAWETAGDAAMNALPAPALDAFEQIRATGECGPVSEDPPTPIPAPTPTADETPAPKPVPEPTPDETPAPEPVP